MATKSHTVSKEQEHFKIGQLIPAQLFYMGGICYTVMAVARFRVFPQACSNLTPNASQNQTVS